MRVVSHPDRPQSNQAHLTVLQYYNMHADITQENNLTHTPTLQQMSNTDSFKRHLKTFLYQQAYIN